jgi:hypothetical protein
MTIAAAPRVMLVQTQAENAGAQEISRLIAADFSSRGFEVHQIFFFRRTASFDRKANVEYCAVERPAKPMAFLRFLLRLYGAMRRIRPDVVIAFQHYGNVIATPIARLARCKAHRRQSGFSRSDHRVGRPGRRQTARLHRRL